MPRIKKPRNKGVTYKLVPRSYGDADGEDQGPLWVSEAELFRRHQSAVPAEDEDAARRQFNMYAVAANAEFNDERRGRRAEEGEDDACGVYDDGEADAEEQSHEEEYYDEHGEEDGEWVDGDWRDEEKPEAPHLRVAMQKAALPPTSAADPALASSCPPAAAACPRDEDGHESEVASEADEEQEEEKLFDDEVEGEVTDDFLRQLVFGSGGDGEGDEDGDDGDDWDGLDQEDSEMWRLLTDDEKAAVKASRRRSTARRRRVVAAVVGEEGGLSRTHAADGTEYPTHDTTQRAVDRQFTEMMREFDADARLNDAYTDDPRTHGALPMDKYLTALEEFVASRAGIDVETAEPYSCGNITAAEDDLIAGLLWSDPTNEVAMYEQNPRGCGFLFGPSASNRFCADNNFDFICRAHQVAMEGHMWTHNDRVLTIFSAPNYCGVNGNKGAVLLIKGCSRRPIVQQYDSAEKNETAPARKTDFAYAHMFT